MDKYYEKRAKTGDELCAMAKKGFMRDLPEICRKLGLTSTYDEAMETLGCLVVQANAISELEEDVKYNLERAQEECAKGAENVEADN